jgi:Ca2+-binding EF-hand superfamily protein
MKKRKRKKLSDRHQEEDLMKDLLVTQQLEYLGRHTHFTFEEVRCLYEMFKAMTKTTSVPGEMDRTLFREVFQRQFGMNNDVMLAQMYYFFDADHEGSISVTEWIKNLSVLLRGNLDEQIKYCYAIYDLNGDGGIGRQEIENLLQGCLNKVPGVEEDILENSRELVEIVLKKLQGEKTGQISFENFRSAVYKDPLLLQALGECIPPPETIRTYMILFCENYNDFTTNFSLEGYPSYSYERQASTDESGYAAGANVNLKKIRTFHGNASNRSIRKQTSKHGSGGRSFGASLIHAVDKSATAFKKLDRRSILSTA